MRFWTSDLHLGHKNIIDYCPGRQDLIGSVANNPDNGVDWMNEALIRNWNEVVKEGDDVMILGDVCMGKRDVSLALLARLNGNKKLVPGNHDNCWAFAKPSTKHDWKQLYRDAGLELWPEQATVQIGKHTVLVCHFPYRGDSHDQDRFLHARPFNEGRILLCGHVHDSWLISWSDKSLQINVGVDAWDYKPASEDQIISLIEEVNHADRTQH